MDNFNEIYDKLLKSNRNNEKVFKSRLKTKYINFLEGKNDIDICKLMNYISKININIDKPIINAKPVDCDTEKKDIQIKILTKKSNEYNNKYNTSEHKYNTLKYEYDKLKTDKDNIIKKKNIEITNLKNKLSNYESDDSDNENWLNN